MESDDVAAFEHISPPEQITSPESMKDDIQLKPYVSRETLPKGIMDSVLNFLSTSSNESILGVLALSAIVTYIVLGRVGLLLIGIALGVVLHASWEGPSHITGPDGLQIPKKRGELALEVSKRLLEWRKQPGEDAGTIIIESDDMSTSDLEYTSFRPAIAYALKSLTDAVLKDYVKYWYEPILPNESTFPDSCRRTLTHFVTTISSHLSRKRTEDTFLQFLTNSSSIIIVFLNELAAAFATPKSSALDAKTVVDQYLENAPESSLANVLSEEQQRKKFKMIAEDILSSFLDSKTYSCPPVRQFLREIFSGIVLESTVKSLSRPEFINEWIIYLLQDGESELMHAIDAGVEGARNQSIKKVSEDAKGAVFKEPLTPVDVSQDQQIDKATQEAIQESKRLSALIASQNIQGTVPEPPAQNQGQELPSTDADEPIGLVTDSINPEQQASILPLTDASSSTSLKTSMSISSKEVPAIILHGARITVDDDAAGNEMGVIKSRPTSDYLLQVEPTSTRSTGWMVFRKYSDFQSLHETLATVSRLNQVRDFSEQFPVLPVWKGKTRHNLCRELERYMQEAMKHEPLAETDRMRRFLEKDSGPAESPAKPVFSFPSQSAFENMGKGVLGALTNAPKGVAGGSRAVFDGVTGVFGGSAQNRKRTNTSDQQSQYRKSTSKSDDDIIALPTDKQLGRVDSSLSDLKLENSSTSLVKSESGESSILVSSPIGSSEFSGEENHKQSSISEINDGSHLAAKERDSWASGSMLGTSEDRTSIESGSRAGDAGIEDTASSLAQLTSEPEPSVLESVPNNAVRKQNPITIDETQMAVELIFAVINELYTLSSAWNIRRTLLTAAKSYILRPGSPTLETIRTLLQESMIESHTSDDALAEYLRKLRENALPTEAELKAWPSPPNEEEKEQLREKARRLFVQRGIPQALTSVMGAVASREALEKIFDSLQVETVARGFVFSLLIQGLRVLTL
ncbi:hypothetical protein N7495_008860 [Penicillium taxi]|uniref:uncharacterized protein n=1 Tax=Penicillium taxi TaxID=168475 RepID=UPI0025457E51|nr:uncharacterized protein N7495_008860 [Penicillium taxi]KAJ5888819.1 hypothetical protein N7495_008860 [Penicillium taxi]